MEIEMVKVRFNDFANFNEFAKWADFHGVPDWVDKGIFWKSLVERELEIPTYSAPHE